MSNSRKVVKVHQAMDVPLGRHMVKQALPLHGLAQISPFILLHHFDYTSEPGEDGMDVPPHPHRGFSPITYMFEGEIAHSDSLGNHQVIGDNEVQWINAGRGLIHSEQASKAFIEKGGHYQGVQLWINLPAARKMNAPSYQAVTKEDIILVEEDGVQLRLISGQYLGKTGLAPSPVFTAMLRMKAGGHLDTDFPEDHNVLVYVLDGEINVNDTAAVSGQLVQLAAAPGDVRLTCTTDAKCMLLAGKPIDEPLVTHGPFVMNTQTEILEAMRDFRNGKMGFLY